MTLTRCVAVALLGSASAVGCFYGFPDVNSDTVFLCKVTADCAKGFTCRGDRCVNASHQPGDQAGNGDASNPTAEACEACTGPATCASSDTRCMVINPTSGGRACVPICTGEPPAECPPDWDCVGTGTTGADVSVCLPRGVTTCCVDVDGDGHGIGMDCLGSDCDEETDIHWSDCGACTDADGDGFGVGCDLGNDCNDMNPHCAGSSCEDADNDGYCPANDCTSVHCPVADCDDANPGCAQSCVDDDEDGFCVGIDCDDTSALHWSDCTLCVDFDEDGYGVDCDLGGDCDDSNSHCWEGDACTDADSDGYCPPLDCNDANPGCAGSCVDEDADGFCVGIDCDDEKPLCWLSCTDGDTDGYCDHTDCADDNAGCTFDCTDEDSDTFCIGHDCDDSPATGGSRHDDCGDCVDVDGDGYGENCSPGPDCDDSDPHCWAECVDSDTDGYCAPLDCDPTEAGIHPEAVETCNGVDDNCIGGADEPGPGLCPAEASVLQTDCQVGACRVIECADNHFDLDQQFDNGCECLAEPEVSLGEFCAADSYIDLGDFVDNDGREVFVAGNIPAVGRTVWYRLAAIDDLDTTGDEFHVSVRFAEFPDKSSGNPNDEFVFTAVRETCVSEPLGVDGTELRWYTNQIDPASATTKGEGLCDPPSCDPTDQILTGTCQPNVSRCSDNSAEFFIGVRRQDSEAAPTCHRFRLRIANGVDPAP